MVPLFNRPLPEAIIDLRELAQDLHWSWNHCSDSLWMQINADIWQHTKNPMSVLQLTSSEQLKQLAEDDNFVRQLKQLMHDRKQYQSQSTWYSRRYTQKPIRSVAYFSMEFGLCESLPLYAGGLGILAGDFLKTASDLGVPLIGIGLLYQQGYFRQTISTDGWQQETYLQNEPSNLPIKPVLNANGTWLHIDTQFLARTVRFRIWSAQVGRVILYLLDSNDPCNQPCDRSITNSLYGGGSEQRLVQEIALGICGWQLIETLGLSVDICHLNEGHAAFSTLERIYHYCNSHSVSFEEGLLATRIGNIFTTHTAVPAGFDRYSPTLLHQYIGEYAKRMGVSNDTILRLGRENPNDQNEFFNMAYLAMRTCSTCNGVSELHQKVSQNIFQSLYPRWPQREVPVNAVTNGIHVPSWDSISADDEWTRIFGKDRWRGDIDVITKVNLEGLSDARLWKMKISERAELVSYARERIKTQWRSEFPPMNMPQLMGDALDPNILTLGFARRFAEYKRTDLLLRDPERLVKLLCNPHYPVQLIVAGKAHPADDVGKAALQRWYQFVHRADVRQHVVFIEDYDISLAQQLVQGVDVWLNTPRRPWEACGTSGMKVLVNGGLNLSTLDGWWAEAYSPDVGWALGDGLEHSQEQDAKDADQLYNLLEQEVVPLFYSHNKQGVPEGWLKKMRASMEQLTTYFSSNRMVQEYIDKLYIPAASQLQQRHADSKKTLKELLQWQKNLHQHWHEIHVGELQFTETDKKILVEATVYLGGIAPNTVAVQMIADPVAAYPAVAIAMSVKLTIEGAVNAYRYVCELPINRSKLDFTLRIIPSHSNAIVPAENNLIFWKE